MWLIGFVFIVLALFVVAILESVFNWDHSVLSFFVRKIWLPILLVYGLIYWLKTEIINRNTETSKKIKEEKNDDNVYISGWDATTSKFERIYSGQKNSLTLESKEKMDKILEYIKANTEIDCYRISFESISKVTDIFESKFGGLPYWNPEEDYPCNKDGRKLVLLAQINFEKEQFDNELLPKMGILQFFIDTDILNGLNDQNGYKVIYHENINKNIKNEEIESLGIKTSSMLDIKKEEYFPFEGEFAISFEKVKDSIGSWWNKDNIIKKYLKENLNDTRKLEYIEDYFSKEEYDYLAENIDASGCKILGYPEFVQGDPRDYSEDETYGTLLLQIDSGGPIMWGDSGICNFFINTEDLKNKDFSNVLYNWDSM